MIAAWLQSKKKPKDNRSVWNDDYHQTATVAAVRTGKVHTHTQTPNTDDTEKCGLQQPSALFFLFFFFLLQTQTLELIPSTLELAESLGERFC